VLRTRGESNQLASLADQKLKIAQRYDTQPQKQQHHIESFEFVSILSYLCSWLDLKSVAGKIIEKLRDFGEN
jgi:hypothetical protein